MNTRANIMYIRALEAFPLCCTGNITIAQSDASTLEPQGRSGEQEYICRLYTKYATTNEDRCELKEGDSGNILNDASKFSGMVQSIE